MSRVRTVAIILLVVVLVFALYNYSAKQQPDGSKRSTATKAKKSDLHALWVQAANARDDNVLMEHISRMLVVREVGSVGHQDTQAHLRTVLHQHNWIVTEDAFTDSTPLGERRFTNIIGSLNPQSTKRYVFAAHYDSKYFKNEVFIGATDSVAPCGLVLDLARVLPPFVGAGVGVDLIFFDGEEAFVDWTAIDSLYGSRHLASKWASEGKLAHIKLFVLFDLMGARGLSYASQVSGTATEFALFADIEQHLRSQKLLQTTHKLFSKTAQNMGIQDDYVPFLQRGVPCVEVIAVPFPKEWHTPRDNASVMDQPTIADLAMIIRAYAATWTK